MAEEAKTAPEVESKETETETPAEVTPVTEKKEESLGELFGVKEEPVEEPRMVPESTFLEMKKELKELKKELKGRSKAEVSEDVDSFSQKYNLPEDFTRELTSLINKENKKSVEEAISQKVKPLEEKERSKKIDELFNQTFDNVLEEMPEFKGLVQKNVIKALAMDPKNQNKKFSELFNEAYGHLVTGKRTLERTNPQSSKFDGDVDLNRAKTDTEYFKQIMSNPEAKKKYNESLISRNKF